MESAGWLLDRLHALDSAASGRVLPTMVLTCFAIIVKCPSKPLEGIFHQSLFLSPGLIYSFGKRNSRLAVEAVGKWKAASFAGFQAL